MIRELRKQKNLDQYELAAGLRKMTGEKWAQADISRYENGKIEVPDKAVKQIAKYFGVQPAVIRGEILLDAPLTPPKMSARTVLPISPDLIPIFGFGNGSGDTLMLNVDEAPIGWTERHPSQENMKNVGALYMYGESMYPRYSHGQLIYLNLDGIPIKQQGCVVCTDEEVHIKAFVDMNSEEIICEQYNPPKKIKIPRSKVKCLYSITGTKEGI